MNSIKLTREDRKLLMQMYKSTLNVIEKKNSLSLLLCHRGVSERKIARMLDIAPDDINLLVTLWETSQEQDKFKFLHVDLFSHELVSAKD
ncbi:MAG: hypothetical protein P4L28_07615 [Paludibacteraceae bacterium]|nr:hypothetical protein [Paludibacteraceae bacterium]